MACEKQSVLCRLERAHACDHPESQTDIQIGQEVGALSSLKRFGQGPLLNPIVTVRVQILIMRWYKVLKCVGGTAAGKFVPQVVQCYNRGSDGYDVQWECKTDMDNAYRFGNIEVICEGYDYPDDQYILRGSCGLEYTLDLTKEGYQQQQQGHHDYYGQQREYQNPYFGQSSSHTGVSKKASSIVGDLIVLGIVAIIIYAVYKTCIASNNTTGYNGNDQDRRDRWGQQRQPPPPGFRDEYMPRGGNSSKLPHSVECPGGSELWKNITTDGDVTSCLGEQSTCKVLHVHISKRTIYYWDLCGNDCSVGADVVYTKTACKEKCLSMSVLFTHKEVFMPWKC
ncbi:hypothetical protein FSP39_006272 [Pinctada imbricata]|uniref:Store-operated calcium entry-associated regulatory factor n=1 Tax=Pinctada imbricata TaxID=66713 RepID=A0AA88XQA5_PINIB|nr:hypothetical protein FSP39_006272 [Pinctada imbricata]